MPLTPHTFTILMTKSMFIHLFDNFIVFMNYERLVLKCFSYKKHRTCAFKYYSESRNVIDETLPGRGYLCLQDFTLPSCEYFCLGRFYSSWWEILLSQYSFHSSWP